MTFIIKIFSLFFTSTSLCDQLETLELSSATPIIQFDFIPRNACRHIP